jgi:hypothetical protein
MAVVLVCAFDVPYEQDFSPFLEFGPNFLLMVD